MIAPGKLRACAVTLLEGEQLVARGMVVIDAEGVPPVIMFDGEAFLPIDEAPHLPDAQTYRKARLLHAGPSFARATILTVVHR